MGPTFMYELPSRSFTHQMTSSPRSGLRAPILLTCHVLECAHSPHHPAELAVCLSAMKPMQVN
jgi:hypothetical protein